MPIDPDKTQQVKVTMPKQIADRLRAVAKQRGIPMSQLLLQAAIDRWLQDDDRLGK